MSIIIKGSFQSIFFKKMVTANGQGTRTSSSQKEDFHMASGCTGGSSQEWNDDQLRAAKEPFNWTVIGLCYVAGLGADVRLSYVKWLLITSYYSA